ncbi:MAG: phosphopantetheine-binding protein, partial [Pseudomonadales bacterium]
KHAPWIRPQDTGRSTNCLINDVGIYVHQRERGFHNYSLPYGWDVRLGHKTRDEAVEELNDNINVGEVETILQEVGYTPAAPAAGDRITAYYAADTEVTREELRAYLAQSLPLFMLPTHYVALETLPVNSSGKTDYAALPDPERLQLRYKAPGNANEIALSGIWAQLFNLPRVGINDNFFELGGDSVLAIQIVAAAQATGLQIQPRQLFEHPTIAELVKCSVNGVSETVESTASKFPLPAINQQDMQQLSAILGELDSEPPTDAT